MIEIFLSWKLVCDEKTVLENCCAVKKTQIMPKLKSEKTKKKYCDQNSKLKIFIKLKNQTCEITLKKLHCDKNKNLTQFVTT